MRQRRLCQQVGVRPSTRPLLSGSVEELPQGKKYLKTIVSHLAPKKADQLPPQRSPGEANCNLFAHQFHFANGQANNQVNGQGYHQAKTRPLSQ